MSIFNEIDQQLKESSWSRIIQHVENDDSFAVISAYLLNATPEDNLKRHSELRTDIRNLGFGYIEQDSGYTYKNKKTGESFPVREKSFFIPKIDYDKAMKLAQKYDQESILYKDLEKGFVLVYAKDFVDNDDIPHKTHEIGMNFKFKKDNKGKITFNPDILKFAYSELIKANNTQRGKQYAFVSTESIEEARIPSRTDAIRGHNYITWKSII